MRKLIHFLQSANYNFKDNPFSAILTSFSKRNEKDVKVMLKMLRGSKLGDVIVTAFDHPKAYPREELRKLALQEGLKFVDDISTHVHGWTHQKTLVVGSYYFLGDLQSLFRNG
jgi:folylpolyglutamate synthase/dihydropteroate synthase